MFRSISRGSRYGRARRSGLRHDGFINLASRGIKKMGSGIKKGWHRPGICIVLFLYILFGVCFCFSVLRVRSDIFPSVLLEK